MRLRLRTKPAYCTGCGTVFEKMHILRNHRNTQRCGGRFLPPEERALRDAANKHLVEYIYFINRPDADHPAVMAYLKYHFLQQEDFTHRANLLRKRRLG